MSLTLKILPVVLANVLSPLAAQAHSATVAPQTVRASPTRPGSAPIDHTIMVYGGVGPNSFPDSFGGEWPLGHLRGLGMITVCS
jgi:hypothetical protein